MAVNRYDTPIQSEFINTYVELPFDQLMSLGREARAEVDKARTELSSTLDKWSDFQSPSDIDTATWYDETIGRVQPVVERLASNPDLIKSAAGRSELYTALNNIDRAKLSSLMQSRDALEQRQKVNQQLALNGRYNPLWHDVDFAGYDTTALGTFSDVSPLAYESIQDLVDPYVKGIQDSFLYSSGLYDYTGVTPDTIAGIIDRDLSGILQTPVAQQHINVFLQQNPGATQEEAVDWFRDRAVQDAMKYARVNRSENRFALEDYKEKIRLASKKASEKEAKVPPNPALLTDMLKVGSEDQLLNSITNNAEDFMYTSTFVQDLPSGRSYLTDADRTGFTNAFRNDLRLQYSELTGSTPLGTQNLTRLNSALNQVLDNVSTDVSAPVTDLILKSQAGEEVKSTDPSGNYYLYNSSKGFKLANTFTLDMMGENASKWHNSKYAKEVEDAITNGDLKNVRVRSTGDLYTYVENGEIKQAIKVSVEVPEQQLKEKGVYNSRWFGTDARARWKELGATVTERQTPQSTSSKPRFEKVVTFEAVQEVPTNPTTQAWINQEWLNSQTSKTYSNDQYVRNQELSFENTSW